jgi:uncharacterized phage infection (PIP) family protein YhgE
MAKLAVGGIAVIAGIAKAADAAVSPFVNYARQVKELSLALGIGSEETSRLIQLSNNYKIEVGELRSALQLAIKNGFAPSVENLADLADEMKGIASPTERAAKLSEIFGRNWTTLVPLLEQGGDAIRDQAAAIEDSLVLNEEAIQQARDYEIQVGDLEDQWMALKITLGREVVPVLVELLTNMSRTSDVVDALRQAMDEGLISGEEFGSTISQMRSGVLTANEAFALFEPRITAAAEATKKLKDEAEAANQPIAELVSPLQKARDMAGEAADSFRALSLGLEDTIEQMLNLTIFQAAGGEALGILAADVAAAFDTGGINLQEMNDLMEAIQREALQIKIDTEMITFEEATRKAEALGISLEDPRRMVGAIRSDLEALTDKSITITIDEIRVPHELGVGGPGGFQQGGQFMVQGPSGPDRVPVSFLATRGETVTVTPTNQAAPSSNVLSGATININSGLDLKAFDAMMRSWLGG